MIIQLILSLGLAGCLLYVVSMGRGSRSIQIVLLAVVLTGMVFVWIPEVTNRIAALVGVGRGADLIMYLWIVLNLVFIVRLHIKLREQSESLTRLARRLALNVAGEDAAGR